MSAYQWKWSLPELRKLGEFDENLRAGGEEDAWLKNLSARRARRFTGW